MTLTDEAIARINKAAPNVWQENEQGVFKEPYGIPTTIKEPVVYMRWETGGVSGGSCRDESDPQPYTSNKGEPSFDVLDLVIKELKPDISYMQFKEIEKLILCNSETDCEYYGNCTEFDIKYIVLSELIETLNSFS